MVVLLHGDCLEVMKTLPDKSVDLFLCDLPYGCLTTPKASTKEWSDYTEKTGKPRTLVREDKSKCAWDVPIDLNAFWREVKRLCRDDHTPVLMFCSTKFGVDLINSNPDWFRYDLVWNKQRGVSFLSANKMPMRSHEMVYVFSKKGATYYRTDITGDFPKAIAKNPRKNFYTGEEMPNLLQDNTGKRCVLSIVEANGYTTRKKGQHPTQKPDDLYDWLITRYSKPGDTVLDPTAGSFASVFSAERLGRHGIGIEKDDGFYETATRRHLTTRILPQSSLPDARAPPSCSASPPQ
jgi:site-specific DNA-methyltransferase (adenine-specific)